MCMLCPFQGLKKRFLIQAAFLLLLLSKCSSYWLNKLKPARYRHVNVKAFPILMPTAGEIPTFRYLQPNIPTLEREGILNWLLPMELKKYTEFY